MLRVDIDTGGTMTDTLVSGGAEPLLLKVESTPHDVTVSFMQSLAAAADALGYPTVGAFLEDVRHIRWSSTITSNVLAERSGPKLGLIVSAGREHDLYCADPAQVATVMPSLIRPEHVCGLPDDADRAAIVLILKRLIDQGIRRISVSLAGAFPHGEREQAVLRIIGEQFPDHYLGSVPALAGSEMLMRPDDMSRTFFALINAYVHNSLASSLFKAEDQVKLEHDWRGDILVGHLSGGVARIGKTKAVDTIESGPLFGAHASAHAASQAGLPCVLAIDIGGTTGKCSVIVDGRLAMRPAGDFFGIPVRTPMAVLRSNALGGGSVARVAAGRITLGPDSMGAAPGPACYGLGGTRATLTDALALLGLVSPSAFLDGRRTLDLDRAAAALARTVAEPLGIELAQAARAVYACAVEAMTALAGSALAESGAAAAGPVTLFAYGGNGPLFATAIAEALGIAHVRYFALGTVWSAYGSSIADVLHVYERALVAGSPAAEIPEAAAELIAQARRDLAGEGFDPAGASFEWETSGPAGERREAQGAPVPALVDSLAACPGAQLIRLTARVPMPKPATAERPPAAEPPAPVTRRSPLAADGWLPIVAHEALRGHPQRGPLAVDGGTFTWYVGPGWRIAVDARGDAVLSRETA